MHKRILTPVAAVLLLTGAAACAQIGWGEDLSSPVNAVFRVDVKKLGATEATVEFYTEEDNIRSFLVAGPAPATECDYLSMDAITRLAFIQEHGKPAESPFLKTLKGLKPRTAYYIGAIGIDAAGTVVTAPTFSTITTAAISVQLSLMATVDIPGDRQATGAITPDESVASYNYVIGQEYAAMSDEELKALLAAKGTGVKSGSGYQGVSFSSATPEDVVLAVLPFGADGDAGDLFKAVVSFTPEKAPVYTCGKELKEVSTGIYEGIVNVRPVDSFTINRDGVEYGFISYSGNGGVGRVENLLAAMPFYNIPEGTPSPYYVEKAVGRMASTAAGGNAFWVNLEAAGPLKIRVDFTRDEPRYYLEFQVPADPSIVLKQNFDLFVWGADYTIPIYGSGVGGGTIASDAAINYDGTEAAQPNVVKTTATGVDPVGYWGEGTLYPCSEEYVKNRDLVGWTFGYLAELAGCVRLSKGTLGWQGWLITPKLSSLSANTTITLAFDCARFGPYAVNMPVNILGSGSFKNGKVDAKGDGFVDVTASGQEYNITAADCPPYENAFANKPWSRVVLTIEGAGPDTQIMWDARPVTSSKSDIRLRIDNILITK